MTGAFRSVRRRFRTLRAHVRSPSDALLALRLFGWRVALAPLKRTVPVPKLVRLMASSPGHPPRDTDRIVELVDWIYAPRRDVDLGNCLDRSLVLYRFLSRDEPGRRLVLGIRQESGALEGHAWVTAGDRAIGVTSGSGGDFVPLATFDAEGRRVGGAASP
jgi:Transglutaminase-like superfamily